MEPEKEEQTDLPRLRLGACSDTTVSDTKLELCKEKFIFSLFNKTRRLMRTKRLLVPGLGREVGAWHAFLFSPPSCQAAHLFSR